MVLFLPDKQVSKGFPEWQVLPTVTYNLWCTTGLHIGSPCVFILHK